MESREEAGGLVLRWTPPSVKEIPPIPVSAQELGGWISERNSDLRNALEFGDTTTVAQIGSLLSQGISGQSRSSMMESLIEESDAKRRLVQVGAETLRVDAREPRVKARHGLRGVRVGEASNPGPSQHEPCFTAQRLQLF